MLSVWSDCFHLCVAIRLHFALTALPKDCGEFIDYLNSKDRESLHCIDRLLVKNMDIFHKFSLIIEI